VQSVNTIINWSIIYT